MDEPQGQPEHVPAGVDPTQPSVARIYDYYLGGDHNYEVDRAVGARMAETFPEIRDWAWCNRGFHQRAARWMAEGAEVDQFIDVGSGLPTQNNTHQVVQQVNPDARVVYVDIDPLVSAHAADLLSGVPNAAFAVGDLRRPAELFGQPELESLIDFDRPVGLLLTAIVHMVPDDRDPWGLVRQCVDAVASGSFLAISHGTLDRVPEEYARRVRELYSKANEQPFPRQRSDVERLFAGLELVPPYQGAAPGLTYGGMWGAEDPASADDDAGRGLYVGVGMKP